MDLHVGLYSIIGTLVVKARLHIDELTHEQSVAVIYRMNIQAPTSGFRL